MANATEQALATLTTAQQARVEAVWAAYEAGRVTLEEAAVLVLNIVLDGNVKAYEIGAGATLRMIEQATGAAEVLDALGSGGHLDADRLQAALATILASETDTFMQLDRLAVNEPKQAAAYAAEDVIRGSKRVTGWVRDLDGPACQLCQWWAHDGRVFRPEHPMPRHPGCGCHQKPVTTTTDNHQTTKQAKQAANRKDRKQ